MKWQKVKSTVLDQSLRRPAGLGVAQVEEALGQNGRDVVETRVRRRCGRRAVGAVQLHLRAWFGREIGQSLLVVGSRIRARLGGRQDQELVARVERSRLGGRENEKSVSGSVGVHCGRGDGSVDERASWDG